MTKTTMVISYIILVAIIVYLARLDWCVIAARVREGPRAWLARLRPFITTPASTAIELFLVLVVINWLYPANWPYSTSIKNFYGQFWTEALGIVITVVIIDQLYHLLQREQVRQLNIQRWREEIEDYLGWDEKEATYRIVGNIRRLNREGVTDIGLHRAFLQEADLGGAKLQGADLMMANLVNADLRRANLCGDGNKTNLSIADLRWADLRWANLRLADLSLADLSLADLRWTDLRGANLTGANLRGTDLTGAKLQGADLREAEYNSKRYIGEYEYHPTFWPINFDPIAAGVIEKNQAGE